MDALTVLVIVGLIGFVGFLIWLAIKTGGGIDVGDLLDDD
jgi:hypothetical protein